MSLLDIVLKCMKDVEAHVSNNDHPTLQIHSKILIHHIFMHHPIPRMIE